MYSFTEYPFACLFHLCVCVCVCVREREREREECAVISCVCFLFIYFKHDVTISRPAAAVTALLAFSQALSFSHCLILAVTEFFSWFELCFLKLCLIFLAVLLC